MLSFANIGTALRSLRRQRGWKQSEVAHAAGITSPMLSAYETGKQRPSFATIDKILFALRFDAGDLARTLKVVNQPESAASETLPGGEIPQIVDLQLGRILEDGLSTSDLEPLEQEIVYRLLPAIVLMLRYLRK